MIGKDKKAGTYYVQLKLKDPLTGATKWHKKRGFKTKREASFYEADAKRQTDTSNSNITFLEVANKWMDSIQTSDKMRELRLSAYRIRFSELCNKPIKSITRPQITEWRSNLAKSNDYSFITKNHTIQYVRGVFKFASEIYGFADVSPLLSNLKRTRNEKQTEKQIVTIDQFDDFIQNVENDLYKRFFIFLYWTGCRRGEALALRCKNVNLDKATVKIDRSYNNRKEGVTPTKTGAARVIRIDQKTVEILRPLILAGGEYVFGMDHIINPNDIYYSFNKAKKKTPSFPKNATLHSFRHSYATNAIINGCNIVAVSKHLGHANIDITLKTYTHLLKEADDELNIIMNDLHS